jgi:hypothetical protein
MSLSSNPRHTLICDANHIEAPGRAGAKIGCCQLIIRIQNILYSIELKGLLDVHATVRQEKEPVLDGAISGIARLTYDKSNWNWLNIMPVNYSRSRNQF